MLKKNLLFIALFISFITHPPAQAAEPRKPIAPAEKLLTATFKLFHPASTATCFLIHHPNDPTKIYLVTAAHALANMPKGQPLLVLRDKQSDGTYQRRDVPVAIREGDKELWTKHETEDIAVLPLTIDEALPSLNAKVFATEKQLDQAEISVTSQLFVFGYPTRFESNGAAFPVARQATVASYPLTPINKHRTYLASFTSFAGDSGGPVFVKTKNNQPLIVGMILALHRHDETIKSMYEERTIHYPLGLSTVVHAKFIAETLEKAAAKGK